MFGKNDETGDLNGFLDRGSHLDGKLTFDASFRVDGHLEGEVRSAGTLVVGEGGEVDGDVEVRRVLVSGEVRGTVRAAEQIHIAPGGRVNADIDTPSLVIEDGALFEGRCTMTREGRPTSPKQGDSVAKLVANAE